MKLQFIFLLALLLLIAPAVFGSQKPSGSSAGSGKDLVLSSMFGQKLNPVARFPADSEIESIFYVSSDVSHTKGWVTVKYVMSSSWKFAHIIKFYETRYPGQDRINREPRPNQSWSIAMRKGTRLLFVVIDSETPSVAQDWSVSKKHSMRRIIVCYINVPKIYVDRIMSAYEGSLVFPIPQ